VLFEGMKLKLEQGIEKSKKEKREGQEVVTSRFLAYFVSLKKPK
jgi:hypothetical protein